MPSLLGLQPPTLLQTILDSVGVALAVIDKAGRFVFTNQAARDMLGHSADPNGMSVLEWRRSCRFQDYQGREIPAEEAPILRALSGEYVEPQDVRITLPDGRRKWLHAASHQFSVLGLSGVLVVITDETEQVELRRAAERFHRIEAVGVLAGGLAHDFNDMLAAVSENVALALSDQGVPETTRTRLQQVALALEKGAALSKRLLQCSRVQRVLTQPVRINEVVNAALELVSPLLKSGIHVKTELRSGLPILEADPTEIEQVLVNLIMNALDAMPEGGELVLRTEVVRRDIVLGHKGDRPSQSVLITVADTGIGIPEDVLDRIFEPFFTTKPGRGAGLGLSSAYGIVRQHEGQITVESAPGVGTKFSIYLPVMATLRE
jgi:two-component system, cell cycle sensor histidine kinase and response regulator CckA